MADKPVLHVSDIPNQAQVLSVSEIYSMTCLRWLADDRIVYSLDDDTIRIWDTTNGKQEGTSMQHDHFIHDFVVTKDGRIISYCHPRFSFDGLQILTVWQAATQKLLSRQPFTEYGPIKNFILSKNTDVLLTSHVMPSRTRVLIFWDVAGTPQVKRPILSLEKLDGEHRNEVCFSPDGKKLAVLRHTDSVAEINIFDVENGQRIFVLPALEDIRSIYHGNRLSWSSDGSRFFCGLYNGSVRCLDSSTCDIIWDSPKGLYDKYEVNHVSQSSNGKWLVSASSPSGPLCLRDIESGTSIGQVLDVNIQPYHINSIVFSPSGDFIACNYRSRNFAIVHVPWWDHDDERLVPSPVLDLSAVISSSGPSSLPPEPDIDFFDVSPHRSVLPRDRPTNDSSVHPVRVPYSPFSGRWWKSIPRLRFILDRSNPVYFAIAPPRSHVASRESVQNTRRSAPSPSPAPIPEQDPTVTVDMPSMSGSSRDDSSNKPDSDLEVHRIGCCGLLSNSRRPRQLDAPTGSSSSTTQPPANSTHTSPPIPHVSSSRAVDHSVLEISAVVRSDADAV